MIAQPQLSDALALDTEATFVAGAMDRARRAQRAWSRSEIKSRRRFFRRLRHLIASSSMALAEASAAQRSRPAAESLSAEVLPLLEACRFLERELASVLASKRVGRLHRPMWLQGVTSVIVREPYGVILIIGPGNYPLLLPGIQMLQAIAAGNAVLLKPGMGGTPTAKKLIALIQDAGFDKDLCIVLPESVEAAITTIDLRPDKVIFTGSSSTGQQILRQLADHAIPSTMELSGCDAVIIREDADLDLAASAIAFGLTLNDGATCMAPRRVLVNARVAKAFETQLITKLSERLRDGAYFVNPEASSIERISASLAASIAQAIDNGAEIIHGSLDPRRSTIYPLVISNVPYGADIFQEDHFAPLIAIAAVATDAEAFGMANHHALGLGASIFTKDVKAASRMARVLEVGVVSINDLIIPTADARLPLGGRKMSGFGSTQGAEGLLEMTVPKVISVSRKKTRQAYAPIRETDGALFTAFAQLSHLQGLGSRFRALFALIDQLKSYKRPNQ
jgi:acyl-CoA reductase-like NAD-dependent aldehyde dehydrogenase